MMFFSIVLKKINSKKVVKGLINAQTVLPKKQFFLM